MNRNSSILQYLIFLLVLLIGYYLTPPLSAWSLLAPAVAVLAVWRSVERLSVAVLLFETTLVTIFFPVAVLFRIGVGSKLNPLAEDYLSVKVIFWYVAPAIFVLLLLLYARRVRGASSRDARRR